VSGLDRAGWLVKWEAHYFTLVWPLFRRLAQAGANGIHSNVLPLLRITLAASKKVIEKSFLPVGFFKSKRQQFLAKHCSQRMDPLNQGYALIWQDYKEMCVIGHKNVAPNCHAVTRSSTTKRTKHLVDFGLCEKRQTLECIECYKIKRVHALKKQLQARRPTRIQSLLVHGRDILRKALSANQSETPRQSEATTAVKCQSGSDRLGPPSWISTRQPERGD